jgi:hypothetical protein
VTQLFKVVALGEMEQISAYTLWEKILNEPDLKLDYRIAAIREIILKNGNFNKWISKAQKKRSTQKLCLRRSNIGKIH